MRFLRKASFFLLISLIIIAKAPVGADTGPARFTVLTFNIWGVIWDAEQRTVRAEAIGRRIAELDPDIIALQEVFEPHHRKVLLKARF